MTKDELIQKTIGFVSLGCDKNRVDLEHIMALLKDYGFNFTNDAKSADIIIINTCAFIESARVESIDTILEMLELKKDTNKKIIVTGCLPDYKFEEIKQAIPEVDRYVNVCDNDKIIDIISNLFQADKDKLRANQSRILTTPNHYSYLKISEGCNNFCAYCTIPYIRGRFKSTPIENLVDEAKELVKKGVKEIILVGQDVTRYGIDLYKKHSLVALIKELSKIKALEQIRLLYCYPEEIDDELIDEIANNDKVCKYIDMPLQHVNNQILKKMNRRNTKEQTISLIEKLREKIPDIAIRTTFIIGLPGENRKRFKELKEFVATYALDHVGFFIYSREEGTRASTFSHQVPNFIKRMRLKNIAKLQREVVTEKNLEKIDKIYDVVVDSIQEGVAVCRSQYQCPDVDNVIYLKNPNLVVGNRYKVKITSIVDWYDLEGEIYEDEHTK